MRRLFRAAVLSSVIAGCLVAASVTPALAATAPAQVSGVKFATQDWANRSLKISWGAVSGATTYVVKRSTSSSLSSPSYSNVSVNGQWFSPLSPGRDYYFAVAAKKGTVAGKWSATFKTRLKANAVAVFPAGTSLKPASNGATLSWPAVANASDYRYRWSAGPNPNRTPDRWTQHVAGWSTAFNPAKRSATIAGTDADLTKTAYGNPIFARAEARDIFFNTTYVRQSAQVVAWPTPTKPDESALSVRFGSYNVMCSGCETSGQPKWPSRGPAVAANIVRKNLDIVTTLEASGDADANSSNGLQQVYTDLDRRLTKLQLTNTEAASNTSDPGNRILYNPDKFSLVATGSLPGIHDYRGSGQDLYTPWAKLQAQSGSRATFLVVAAHYGIPTTTNATTRKSQLGTDSAQLLTALNKVNTSNLPVILGADFNDSRYPEGRTDGAQPTLIRGGFYDSSASLHRYGTDKNTYNGYKAPSQQIPDANGDGQRIDYILTKGFQGSDEFTNEWNPGGSVIASDHNLITSVLRVP
jgi:hypothetical protein